MPLILLSSFNKSLTVQDGIIVVGASVRVQHFIREALKHSLGGVECLFSVPCTVGGATVMNAGRGNRKQSIGNSVEKVRCLNAESGEIEILTKEECDFSFRKSVFQYSKRIVLSTYLKLEEKTPEAIEKGISERKQYALEKLDDRRPSCGSIINASNGRIMSALKGFRIGEAEWSKKTINCVSNTGKAKYWQIRMLVGIACLMHIIMFKSYNLEVEIWKK